MRSIDANTSLLFLPPEWREDVRQDALDRLLTPVGDRVARPEYGIAAEDIRDITLGAARDALLYQEGAITSVNDALYTDSELHLQVTAKPFEYTLRMWWSYTTDVEVSGNRRFIFFPVPGNVGPLPLPDEWSPMPPAPQYRRVAFRMSGSLPDNLSTRIRMFPTAANLWAGGDSGLMDQYANYFFYFQRGELSALAYLNRQGQPSVNTTRPFYQWLQATNLLNHIVAAMYAGLRDNWRVALFQIIPKPDDTEDDDA